MSKAIHPASQFCPVSPATWRGRVAPGHLSCLLGLSFCFKLRVKTGRGLSKGLRKTSRTILEGEGVSLSEPSCLRGDHTAAVSARVGR